MVTNIQKATKEEQQRAREVYITQKILRDLNHQNKGQKRERNKKYNKNTKRKYKKIYEQPLQPTKKEHSHNK